MHSGGPLDKGLKGHYEAKGRQQGYELSELMLWKSLRKFLSSFQAA